MLTLAAIIISFLGLVLAGIKWFFLEKQYLENQAVREAGERIRTQSIGYLRQESLWIVILAALTAIVLLFVSWQSALLFVLGALFAGAAACVSAMVSTRANARIAEKASSGTETAFKAAFSFGSVLGISIPALSVLSVSALSLIFPDWEKIMAFGLGASLVALMIRVGGGLYAKASDMGSDWAGKSENLSEDDPRNPALVAANAGDNVSDVAGLATNFFESLVNALATSLIFGMILLPIFGSGAVALPLALFAWGLVCVVFGLFSINFFQFRKAIKAVYLISIALFLIGALVLIRILTQSLDLFWPVFFGSVSGLIVSCLTAYFVSAQRKPAIKLARTAAKGIAPTLIEGAAVGLMSLVFISVIAVLTIYLAHRNADIYGLVLAVAGMLSVIGIMIALEIAGHIADNAGGIIGMAGLGGKAQEASDEIDAMGNTRAAVSKSLVSVSSLILSLVLLIFLIGSAGLANLDLLSMRAVIGLIAGSVLPLAVGAWLLRKANASALKVADEVKSQLAESRTDYEAVVKIVSKAGIMPMALIGILSLAGPLLLGRLFGLEFLISLFFGFMIAGFLLSVFSAVSGGVWDNAKKLVEKKETDALTRQAAVAGDTLGDPLKDLIGPMMNVLIKVMILAVLVFLPFLI